MLFDEKKFGDAQLEHLYQQQQLRQNSAQLVYVLCVFTAALLLIALNHLPNPDFGLLLATLAAGFALTLNILLNLKLRLNNQIQIATIFWIIFFILFTLTAGEQHALLPVIIANFTIYTLLPFGLFLTLALCFSLSLTQTLAFILLTQQKTNEFVVDQVCFFNII